MQGAPYVERKLTMADGTVLHVAHHAPVGHALGILVMLHGFSVHSGRYRHVAAAFAQFGLAVTAFDCRGHGQSTGRRGYVRRFQDFTDDLHEVIGAARRMNPSLPVTILGHSQGGTIALGYALQNRSPLSALLLAAPWLGLKLKIPSWKLVLVTLFGQIFPTLPSGNELRSEITTRDPAVRARLADDPLVHHVATPRWFSEVRAAQAYILGHASTLRVPTFMGVAADDRLVATEKALAFAAAAGAMVEVKVYDQAFHELFLEPEWMGIVEDFASWVVARLAAPYTSVVA